MADLIFTGATMLLLGAVLLCGGLWLQHLDRRDKRDAERRHASMPVTPTGGQTIQG